MPVSTTRTLWTTFRNTTGKISVGRPTGRSFTVDLWLIGRGGEAAAPRISQAGEKAVQASRAGGVTHDGENGADRKRSRILHAGTYYRVGSDHGPHLSRPPLSRPRVAGGLPRGQGPYLPARPSIFLDQPRLPDCRHGDLCADGDHWRKPHHGSCRHAPRLDGRRRRSTPESWRPLRG